MEKVIFYKRPWFLWLCVILCPPAGFALLWIFHRDKKLTTKIFLSVVFLFISYIWVTALLDEAQKLSGAPSGSAMSTESHYITANWQSNIF